MQVQQPGETSRHLPPATAITATAGTPRWPHPSSRAWPWLIAAIALPLCWYIAHAAALRVPLQHIDGAFQTIAMLRHLDAGELPGRDFQPYLGIGIPLLLWPLYQLGGGTLVASQAAAIFGGLLATFLGGSLLTWLLLRAFAVARPTLPAFGGGLLLLCAALPGSAHVHSLVLPGASLYSLRSALAYMVAGCVYLAAREGRWRPAWSGIGTALALTWSNDYALTGVLAMHVLLLLHVAAVDRWASAWRGLALSLATGLAGYAALGSLLTGGHLGTLLHYNFGAVAADQHWYFAPYDRIEHFLTPGDLLRYWDRDHARLSFTLLAYPLFALLLLVPAVRRVRATMAISAACLTAFGAGLGSELGGHKALNYHQLALHLFPVFGLALLAATLRSARPPALDRLAAIATRRGNSLRPHVEVTLLALLALAGTGATLTASQHRDALARDPYLQREPVLGGYVPRATAAEFARVRAAFGEAPVGVVSTYLNPWDLLLEHRQRAPTDSIIHALGELRPRFVAALDDPRVARVVTTNARSPFSVDARWENWGLHQNWPFYRRLVAGFTPAFSGTRLVLWTRATAPQVREVAAACEITPARLQVRLSVAGQRAGDLHDLDIAWRHRCDDAFTQRRALVLARAASRRGHLGGAFSLPPAGTAHVLHAPLADDDALAISVTPLERCTLQVLRCSATRIDGVAPAARAALDLPDAPR
jgi:hypothetical protein